MLKIISAFTITLLISTNAHSDGLQTKPHWNDVEHLVNTSSPLVIATSNKTTYIKDDKLTLAIVIDKPGFLNVVTIDDEDEITVLFPNKLHTDNHVSSGTFVFPTRKMNFKLVTQAPFGKTLVAAFLTADKVNLYQLPTKSLRQSQSESVSTQIFKQLTSDEAANFSKGFGVEATSLPAKISVKPKVNYKFKAGKIELMTCETTEKCE